MRTRIIFSAILILLLTGCAELMKVLQTAGNLPLTEAEVISGLKEALNTGAGNAVRILRSSCTAAGRSVVQNARPKTLSRSFLLSA